MSRRVMIGLLAAAGGVAHADPEPSTAGTSTRPTAPPEGGAVPSTTALAPADVGDQGIGAELGLGVGGRDTPGGVRVTGHYLYQLADRDWFDGTAAFTFGSGAAQCFRDRMNSYLCEHGPLDGDEVEIGANVRRFIGGKDKFWPFLRAGLGVAIVRYSGDGVTGLGIPLHAGGGLRVSVAPSVAVTAQAELDFGFGVFGHGLGLEPQLGLVVTAGAEFKL